MTLAPIGRLTIALQSHVNEADLGSPDVFRERLGASSQLLMESFGWSTELRRQLSAVAQGNDAMYRHLVAHVVDQRPNDWRFILPLLRSLRGSGVEVSMPDIPEGHRTYRRSYTAMFHIQTCEHPSLEWPNALAQVKKSAQVVGRLHRQRDEYMLERITAAVSLPRGGDTLMLLGYGHGWLCQRLARILPPERLELWYPAGPCPRYRVELWDGYPEEPSRIALARTLVQDHWYMGQLTGAEDRPVAPVLRESYERVSRMDLEELRQYYRSTIMERPALGSA